MITDEKLGEIGWDDPSGMSEIIDKLVEAKTYMK
jgi:hypothetical protein